MFIIIQYVYLLQTNVRRKPRGLVGIWRGVVTHRVGWTGHSGSEVEERPLVLKIGVKYNSDRTSQVRCQWEWVWGPKYKHLTKEWSRDRVYRGRGLSVKVEDQPQWCTYRTIVMIKLYVWSRKSGFERTGRRTKGGNIIVVGIEGRWVSPLKPQRRSLRKSEGWRFTSGPERLRLNLQ